jgi:arylsulfatase A-like enzyme
VKSYLSLFLGTRRLERALFICLAEALYSLVGLSPVSAAERPNIVFMMADDHTSQAWSCYGGRLAAIAKTPNIDRLAAEGALLKNCFCVNSICVPSRASILTGQYSHRNGVKTLRDALPPTSDNVAKRLQQAGYQTALVGKWHLKDEPAGFDYWNVIKGQGRYHEPILFEMDLEKGEVQEGGYSTDVFTDKALGWLDSREEDKPFCLMLHFKATHEPWNFHPRHAALFDGVEIPAPETLFGHTGPANSRVPGWPLEILTERMSASGRHGAGKLEVSSSDPMEIRGQSYQKFIKDFLRCGAAIDENIGRVLDYLNAHQLTENTIVVYTSDQGYFLGEHNYFDKRFMLEESLRMPFVVRYPKEIAPHTVVKDMVLNVDFAQTFLDYAGGEASPSMQGKSFRGVLAGKTPPNWRSSMYYRYFENSEPRPSHFGIRTKQHKLIYYDGLANVGDSQRWEFYDLEKDPYENTNQYDAVAGSGLIRDLKGQLSRLQTEADDRP